MKSICPPRVVGRYSNMQFASECKDPMERRGDVTRLQGHIPWVADEESHSRWYSRALYVHHHHHHHSKVPLAMYRVHTVHPPAPHRLHSTPLCRSRDNQEAGQAKSKQHCVSHIASTCMCVLTCCTMEQQSIPESLPHAIVTTIIAVASNYSVQSTYILRAITITTVPPFSLPSLRGCGQVVHPSPFPQCL